MKIENLTEEQIMSDISYFYNKIRPNITEEFKMLNNQALLTIDFNNDFLLSNEEQEDFFMYDKNINKFKLSISSGIKNYKSLTIHSAKDVNVINKYENDFFNRFTKEDQESLIYYNQIDILTLLESNFLYCYISKLINIVGTTMINYKNDFKILLEKRGTFWNQIIIETEARRFSKKYNILYLPHTIGYKEIFMTTLGQLNNLNSRSLILNNQIENIMSNFSIFLSQKINTYEKRCFEEKYNLKENILSITKKESLKQIPLHYKKQELLEELKKLREILSEKQTNTGYSSITSILLILVVIGVLLGSLIIFSIGIRG